MMKIFMVSFLEGVGLQRETHVKSSLPIHLFTSFPLFVPHIPLTGIIFRLPFFSSYCFYFFRCSGPLTSTSTHNSVTHPGEKYMRMEEGGQEGQGKDLTRIFLGQRQDYCSEK